MNRLKLIAVFGVILIAGLVVFVFIPEKANKLNVDVSKVENNMHISHFDDAFFTCDTNNFLAELDRLKTTYEPFFSSTNDSKFWYDMRTEGMQKKLYADLKKVIPNYVDFDEAIFQAFSHLYYYYPNMPDFQVYTYISRLDIEHPIIVADRLVFIATDLYLGKFHPAYQYQSDYQNYTHQPAFIIPDVMQNLAYTLARKNADDSSLLNDMIWWGKVYYFKEAMQPGISDTVIAAYSGKHYSFCSQNEVEIWTYFIDNKLLFDTSVDAKRKFIEPAPYSKFGMPFDNDTPGMIGRWLGWQIVRSYMLNNPDVSLQQLMAETDSRTLFRNSKYKP